MSGLNRQHVDWVTNPSFAAFLRELDEVIRKETEGLKNRAREGEISKVNVCAGIVEGVTIAKKRMENFRIEVLGEQKDDTGDDS